MDGELHSWQLWCAGFDCWDWDVAITLNRQHLVRVLRIAAAQTADGVIGALTEAVVLLPRTVRVGMSECCGQLS